jgi:hypothetical protein
MKFPLLDPMGNSSKAEKVVFTAAVLVISIAVFALILVALLKSDGICISLFLFFGIIHLTFAISFWRRTTLNVELWNWDFGMDRRESRLIWLIIAIGSFGIGFYMLWRQY